MAVCPSSRTALLAKQFWRLGTELNSSRPSLSPAQHGKAHSAGYSLSSTLLPSHHAIARKLQNKLLFFNCPPIPDLARLPFALFDRDTDLLQHSQDVTSGLQVVCPRHYDAHNRQANNHIHQPLHPLDPGLISGFSKALRQ